VSATVYPVGLVVSGRPCLVVGGGTVAARKIASLLACGAAVTVVAPEAHVAMGLLTGWGAIRDMDGPPLDLQLRRYRPGEAAKYRLVVTATGNPEVDAAVFEDAEAAGVWVNSADDTEHCSVVLPAVWREGPVTVAVSTGGASPAVASWVRDTVADALTTALGGELGTLADLIADGRAQLRSKGIATSAVDWGSLLHGPFQDLVRNGRIEEAKGLLETSLEAAVNRQDQPEEHRD